ncbi:protein FAR1-RELATED SEQUENCE 5-like [Asparagus officinalis]|uniref:protein FAR1-RELATED SEQUENCE 5-like n=1 Tax=Asparagus officinalis TaxID=4686 RepID=UPI00098E2382|nr:protein FAR1-RELATED SEQUENCE 5-like [Asparagus officinalis]
MLLTTDSGRGTSGINKGEGRKAEAFKASKHEENVDEPIGVKNGKGNLVVDLYIGMKFSTHEEGYNFYNAYARLKGFGFRKSHTFWSRKKDASKHEENVDEPIGVENGKGNHVVDLYIGMEFSTYEECYNFYNAYARLKGFGFHKSHTFWSRKKDVIICRTFVCDKEGFKFLEYKREDDLNVIQKSDTRCGCNVRMVIRLDRSTRKWVV